MPTEQEQRVLGMLGNVDLAKLDKRKKWVGDAIELLMSPHTHLNDWEDGFVDSIFTQHSKDKQLSDKQFETLNKLIKKHHPGEEYV